ncbi:hypothetical protein [Arthrobacter castelli]|uniref:hypothetical protein n=1 Tax=Arthrobacter castelli TaxID=271431 RepID=UPI001FE1B2B4|nr:hypothetical protein [Arthrobacter castelli]
MAEDGRNRPRRDGNRAQPAGKADGRGGPPRKPQRQDRQPSGGDRRGGQARGGAQAPGSGGERSERTHNPRDLRSSNRQDRERSPEIDPEVTGKELDKVTRAQLRNLEERNADWVSRHLVMAGRLIDEDPELAFEHALAASRRGGRMALVREAVGLTAYAAGRYGEALREFRTFRRITGSHEHLPVMVDCERGLGRPEKALEAARADEARELDTAGKVELAIVVSGARADLNQVEAAVTALEIPQLDRKRAYSFSPRLFRAYADALENAGREQQAASWRRTANIAEEALGTGDFADPDIVDLSGDEEDAAGPDTARES